MKIGFIGLGTMGSRMASNLIKGGHALVINDMNQAAAQPLLDQGAVWADTPALLAPQVDLVLMSLPGPAQVQEVLTGTNGLASGLRAGSAIFDLSTNAPRSITYPINTKSGMDKRVSLVIAPKVRCTIRLKTLLSNHGAVGS